MRVQPLASQRGYIDLDNMSSSFQEGIKKLGISKQDLSKIAGSDHVIRGDELNAVSRLISERSDRTGGRKFSNRAKRLFAREMERNHKNPPAAEKTEGPSGRPRAGLRGEMVAYRRDGAGQKNPTYGTGAVPELKADSAAPERPGWFRRLLETLFGWLGLETDTDRLKDYGKKLADEHGSDIQAYQQAYVVHLAAQPAGPLGQRPPGPEIRESMIEHLADRFQAETKARGETMPRKRAIERATVVVEAMEKQLEANGNTAAKRVGELKIGAKNESEAPLLAQEYFPAVQTAKALGGDWSKRLERAMAKPSSDHPIVEMHPDMKARAENAVRIENVRAVSYLMALERSGQLKQVPSSAVDSLLEAQRQGWISNDAMANTVTAIGKMPPEQRQKTLKAINALPKEQRVLAWATMAREHLGLRSSKSSERDAGMKRVERAISQLSGMKPGEAKKAFQRGTLGLDGPEQLEIDHGNGKTSKLPLYFHPGVPEAKREQYREVLREAYSRMPAEAVQALVKGEGGQGFNVQILPDHSLEAGLPSQRRPDPEAPIGGFIRLEDNQIRLNASDMEKMMGSKVEGEGREKAIHYVVHESTHLLDDLADKDQVRGFFLGHDAKRAHDRTVADGDLAPAWAHFHATQVKHNDIVENLVDDPIAREAYMLASRGDARTQKEEARLIELNSHMAARAGAVSGYGAEGGDESVHSRGVNLGEWWAETNTAYLNPKKRDHLRAVDPVGYAAAKQYNDLLRQGASPKDAMQQSLRFNLSTEVSAQQGQRMLEGKKPLSEKQLKSLEGITAAFETHQKALKGWKGYKGKGLRTMRRDQAMAGVKEGRKLLAAIDARRTELEGAGKKQSPEYKRLTAIRARLEAAVGKLEKNAKAIDVSGAK